MMHRTFSILSQRVLCVIAGTGLPSTISHRYKIANYGGEPLETFTFPTDPFVEKIYTRAGQGKAELEMVNGTKCAIVRSAMPIPRGAIWQFDISSDHLAYTAPLSKYEVAVTLFAKDCRLTVDLPLSKPCSRAWVSCRSLSAPQDMRYEFELPRINNPHKIFAFENSGLEDSVFGLRWE